MPNPSKPELRGLRSQPVQESDLVTFVNRELLPLVLEMRQRLNESHLVKDGDSNGDTLVWNATTSEWELT